MFPSSGKVKSSPCRFTNPKVILIHLNHGQIDRHDAVLCIDEIVGAGI
jgi:hypothetical protein